jgi:hypothetical protein
MTGRERNLVDKAVRSIDPHTFKGACKQFQRMFRQSHE